MSSKPSSPDYIAGATTAYLDAYGGTTSEQDRELTADVLDAAARELTQIARGHQHNGLGNMTWAECTTKLTFWARELRGDTTPDPERTTP